MKSNNYVTLSVKIFFYLTILLICSSEFKIKRSCVPGSEHNTPCIYIVFVFTDISEVCCS